MYQTNYIHNCPGQLFLITDSSMINNVSSSKKKKKKEKQ